MRVGKLGFYAGLQFSIRKNKDGQLAPTELKPKNKIE